MLQKQTNCCKKSHTCKEGGSTPHNFFLAFIDELEKPIIIKKNCWSGSIKTDIQCIQFTMYTILIFTMLHLKKKKNKNKEKHF